MDGSNGSHDILSGLRRDLSILLSQKREAGLKDNLIRKIADSFRRDWKSFIRVEVSNELNEYIDTAVAKYPLRGFYAIYLASAMIIHERLKHDFIFVCFDQRLIHAAQTERIKTFPFFKP